MAKFKFGPNNAKDATDSELQISAPVSPVDKQVGFTPATPLIPAELQKAEDALANFQQGIQAKIFASLFLYKNFYESFFKNTFEFLADA